MGSIFSMPSQSGPANPMGWYMLILMFAVTLHSSMSFALDSSVIKTYSLPSGVINGTSYSILVNAANKPFQQVDTFFAKVAQVNTTSGKGIEHNTSVALLDFSHPVNFKIQYHNGPIKSVDIRPYSLGIHARVAEGVIEFSLPKPQNILIQVNDDLFDTLQLFSNSIETSNPVNDPNVIYFGPGVNNGTGIQNGVLSVPSGKTVYVAGGGLLTAQVAFQNVSNSAVIGRGMLATKSSGAVLIEYSSNITVKDVIMLNPNGYAVISGSSEGVTISGIRSFSSKGNGDGIDIFCSQNVLIEGVFMRNSDDNIALYQHRWNYYGDSKNITVQNSALWADYAHPINIGTHGNTPNPETMDGVTIRNIDILNHHEPQLWYQGCIAINAGDSNLIENVYIDDVRVEDFQTGQLLNFHVMDNTKYNTSPGRGIRNVVIKDLVYNGHNANPSQFLGYDEERIITNVTFINLTVNGLKIYDAMQKPTWYYTADFVPLFANEHVYNLTFTSV
jgi:hypothetical protein